MVALLTFNLAGDLLGNLVANLVVDCLALFSGDISALLLLYLLGDLSADWSLWGTITVNSRGSRGSIAFSSRGSIARSSRGIITGSSRGSIAGGSRGSIFIAS